MKKLNITEAELNSLPPIPFDFLLTKNVTVKSVKNRNRNHKNGIFYSTGNSHKVTLGDLYGNVFKNFLKANGNESN